MSRFFFDIQRGTTLVRDHTGLDLPSVELARNEALHQFFHAIENMPDGKDTKLVLEVRDANNSLLVRATDGALVEPAPNGNGAIHPEIERLHSEQLLANDIAKWVIEQRKEIVRLKRAGQDTVTLERILYSLSDLIAQRLATRIRHALER